MHIRELFGLSKPLSEKGFLEIELDIIKSTKNQILIFGYDNKFHENEIYLSSLRGAIKRGVKTDIIVHKISPPNKLDELANEFDIKIYRSNNRFLINKGFRTFDDNSA